MPADSPSENAFYFGIVSGNIEIISALEHHSKGRVEPSKELVKGSGSGTGFLAKNTFRHSVKVVNESRGNREGNTAFYKNTKSDVMKLHRTKYCLQDLASHTILDALSSRSLPAHLAPKLMASFIYGSVITDYGVYEAASAGDIAMVNKLLPLVGEYEGFNVLHKAVVQDKAAKKPLPPYRSNQIFKKATGNKQITPVHLAAIHPKSTYLERFHDEISGPDFLIQDGVGRTVAHFAAVSDTSDCLAFLIKRGIAINGIDSLKVTPFMLSAMYGKHQNIPIFVKALGATILSEKQPKYGWTPLHFAAHFGHTETVKQLLALGAQVDVQDKETKGSPLHHAAKMGHLQVVDILLKDGGADPELCDKFGRTPLHLAAKNGRYDIALHLLQNAGVDADAKDTSDNTPLHYAAAYGWYDLVMLLEMVGHADVNAANNWRTTPMAIAALKGHLRIVNHFLANPNVNAAFKNQNGETLLHQCAVEQPLNWYEARQLIEKASCLISREDPGLSVGDIQGNTPLHHLASSPYYIEGEEEEPTSNKSARYKNMGQGNSQFEKFDDFSGTKIQLQLAKLLMKSCTDADAKNKDGHTPLAAAMESGHIDMATYLINSGKVDAPSCRYSEDGNNVVHFLLNQAAMLQLKEVKCKEDDKVVLKQIEHYKLKIDVLWKSITTCIDAELLCSLFATSNNKGCYPIMSSIVYTCKLQEDYITNQTSYSRRFSKPLSFQCDYVTSFIRTVLTSVHPNLDLKQDLPRGYFDKKTPPTYDSEPERTGWSALHYATTIDAVELVNVLLDHGADPNSASSGHNDGFSPLQLAVSRLTSDEHISSTPLDILVSLIHKGGNMFSIPIAPENKYGPEAKQNLQFKDSAFMKILKDQPIEIIEKCLQAHEASMDNEDIHYCISQPGDHGGITPLMVAIQEDSIPKVQLVLARTPNINVTNVDGATALMYALAKNLPNCHQIVCAIFGSLNGVLLDLDIVDTKGHNTMSLIGKYGNAALMDLLIEHIPAKLATANAADNEGKTPLYWACRHNSTVVVQKLILAGANPNLKPHNSDAAQGWMTPLMAAIHHYTPKSLETVNMLIQGQAQLGIADSRGRTALHFAANVQSYHISKILLEKGAAANARDSLGRTPLHISVLSSLKKDDKTLMIEMLLASHGADINAQDYQGRTPLHLCFSIAGVIPFMRSSEAFHRRATRAHRFSEDIIRHKKQIHEQLASLELGEGALSKCLIDHKALPACRALDKVMESQEEVSWFNQSPYRVASWESEFRKDLKDDPIDLITFFLGDASLNINVVDLFGRTPFHYAARVGAFTCTKHLLDKGANLDPLDHDGLTPFHLSLLHGHVDYSTVLFNRGVDGLGMIHLPKNPPISPFCYALSKSYMPLAYLLIEKKLGFIGAIKDTLKSGKFFLASNLLKQASAKDLSEIQPSSLHNLSHAITSFKPADAISWDEYLPDYLTKIKELNISTTLPDSDQATPLILSIQNHQSTLALELISQHPSPSHLNHLDSEGKSALWHSIDKGMEDVACKLLEHNVTLDNAQSTTCPSVLYLAVNNVPTLVKRLIEQGANPNLDAIHGRRSAFMRTLFNNHPTPLSERKPLWEALIQAKADINAQGPVNITDMCEEPSWILPTTDAERKDAHLIHPAFLIKDLPYPIQSHLINSGLGLDCHHPVTGECFISLVSRNHAKFYLNHGANINLAHKHTNRPFLYEIIMSDRTSEVVEDLIGQSQPHETSSRFEVTAKDPVSAMTPLEYAAKQDNISLVKWLLDIGADPHHPSATDNAVIYSLVHNKAKAFDCLLAHASRTKSWDKWTASDESNRPYTLVRAITMNEHASYQHSKLVKRLLSALKAAGHDIDALAHQACESQLSAIKLAAMHFHPHLYKVFLAMKCTPLPADTITKLKQHAKAPYPGVELGGITPEQIAQDAQLAKLSLMTWHDAKLKEGAKEEEREIPEVERVDPKSDLEGIGELARGKDGELLSVLMNRTKVESAYYTNNMFYKLQLIHNPIQDVYVLLTRWGSIGDIGAYQRTPFQDYQAGLKEFQAVFKAKSGNTWDCRHPDKFTSRPGRFVLTKSAPPQHYMASFKQWRQEALSKSPPPSSLPSGVHCLMGIFYQLTSMQHHAKSDPIPFGQRDVDSISQARQLLNSIKETLKEIEAQSEPGVGFDAKSLSLVRHKLVELNSQYFTLIPKASKKGSSLKPILNLVSWTKEALNLEKLHYLQAGSDILLAAIQRSNEVNPLDYCYSAVGCRFQEVSRQDSWYSMVERYMDPDSQGNHELVGLFTAHREEEEANFKPFEATAGRKLLWHGSRAENYLGILSKGLRPAPMEAIVSGYMFGKGIYFADTFKKSVGYSVSDSEKSKGYRCLLLCEVALGTPYPCLGQEFMVVPKDKSDSTKGVGSLCPDPEGSVYLVDGTEIPLGSLVNSEERSSRVREERAKNGYCAFGPLVHNEYVVYDHRRVKIRALVVVKEKSTCHLCCKASSGTTLDALLKSPDPTLLARVNYSTLAPLVPSTSFGSNQLEQVLADLTIRQHGFASPNDFLTRAGLPTLTNQSCAIINKSFDSVVPIDPESSKLCASCIKAVVDLSYQEYMLATKSSLPEAVKQRPDCRFGFKCRHQSASSTEGRQHLAQFSHICHPSQENDVAAPGTESDSNQDAEDSNQYDDGSDQESDQGSDQDSNQGSEDYDDM
ncbi:hypothetical protein DSO57_1033133 [Entomophthora muscae]|nr:hypothetical protein DSO57_1033133 [Entomophthora muscae]